MAIASPAPSLGSVPLPISSHNISVDLLLLSIISAKFFIWEEKVLSAFSFLLT
jgi:hypothetical protein